MLGVTLGVTAGCDLGELECMLTVTSIRSQCVLTETLARSVSADGNFG